MNIEASQIDRSAKTKLEIVDCDFHPKASLEQMRPFLSNQWWNYLQTYGNRSRHGYAKGYAYPKMTPQAARRDAWPPGGGLPASDLDFVRQQHLDFYGIEHGDHESAVADRAGRAERRTVGRDGVCRQRGAARSLDRARSAAEVVGGGALRGRRRVAQPKSASAPATSDFAQVFMLSRTGEAAGRKRYWPIYEAAVEAGLPVGIHAFGYSGWPMTQFRLSVVLHRGDDRARHLGARSWSRA